MNPQEAHDDVLCACHEHSSTLPDPTREALQRALRTFHADNLGPSRETAHADFHRFLWRDEDLLSLIPADALVSSRKFAFPTFQDAAIQAISTILIQSQTFYPTLLWRDNIWFPVHAIWKLYYYLQIRDTGQIVGIEGDPHQSLLSQSTSQGGAIRSILRSLGEGTEPELAWGNHPSRLLCYPQIGVPRKKKTVARIVTELRARDANQAAGWAIAPYPRIENITPTVRQANGLYPGGFFRGIPSGLTMAYRMASYYGAGNWRLALIRQIMRTFLLRQDRRQGHIREFLDGSSLTLPVIASRISNNWYFPLTSLIVLASHLGQIPILSKRINGDRYLSIDDFWLCGGATILANHPLYDVQFGNDGRQPCLKIPGSDFLPHESEETQPDGDGSILHGRVEHIATATQPKFLI